MSSFSTYVGYYNILGVLSFKLKNEFGAKSLQLLKHWLLILGYTLVCRYVLESKHMKNLFGYIQLPNFDIASDAAATFKVMYSD